MGKKKLRPPMVPGDQEDQTAPLDESSKKGTGKPRTQVVVATAGPHQLDDQGFLIVGIGASAGGLEAFKQLIEQLPANTGMAFVLVQHLDPKHASHLGLLREFGQKTTLRPLGLSLSES